ncbi:PC4/YdbC family ssDNA-binding protein [Candidatus Xianfuyuplasma coldseepsis]|uniref:Transcriptional coactivator p15 (PC4) C-terminal domain-containing protein n=1 Tax=Candidatus Xianfuyuplasma coldseepsis TaxID=2782163 RepID=A0A7L7KR92_9MOLU|nr:PC4/YdbC family ssDNA-binding protein [Xianfuyuplasma coldseepsis]QMS85105.1 hypothetical protein G4Z02_04890 [Xianfuyuplasma coldseepsis]
MDEENIIDVLNSNSIFENEYFIVYKILVEIPTQSVSWVKRVQLVNWKHKKSDLLELDIRRFSKKDDRYAKGISLTKRELKDFLTVMKEFNIDELKNDTDVF